MANNDKIIKPRLDLSDAESQMSSFLQKYQNTPVKINLSVDSSNISTQISKQLQTVSKEASITNIFQGLADTSSKLLSDTVSKNLSGHVTKGVEKNLDQPQITGCPCFRYFRDGSIMGENIS